MSVSTTPEITTLLSEQTTLGEKTLAANNIINDYNLNLVESEILYMFSKARLYILFSKNFYPNSYSRNEYLFNFLLTQNTGMFTALINAKNYNKTSLTRHPMIFINQQAPFKVGCDSFSNQNFIFEYYKTLLNYNDFNIDNLELPEIARKQIQEYRNKKYGGKLTKVAN